MKKADREQVGLKISMRNRYLLILGLVVAVVLEDLVARDPEQPAARALVGQSTVEGGDEGVMTDVFHRPRVADAGANVRPQRAAMLAIEQGHVLGRRNCKPIAHTADIPPGPNPGPRNSPAPAQRS